MSNPHYRYQDTIVKVAPLAEELEEADFDCEEVGITIGGGLDETTKMGKPASREAAGDDWSVSLKIKKKKGQNLHAADIGLTFGSVVWVYVYPIKTDLTKKWSLPCIVEKEMEEVKVKGHAMYTVELKAHGDTGTFSRPTAT